MLDGGAQRYRDEIASLIGELSWQAIYGYNSLIIATKPLDLRVESQMLTETLLAMSLVHRTWLYGTGVRTPCTAAPGVVGCSIRFGSSKAHRGFRHRSRRSR